VFASRPGVGVSRGAALLNRSTMPSALPTLAATVAPGAVPIVVPWPTVTVGITAGSAACSALLSASRFEPPIWVVDWAKLVWVSLLPHRNAVTCLFAGRLAHGVSGPIVSGRSVPGTTVCMPGLCHDRLLLGVAASAIARRRPTTDIQRR